jgi:hypothetical protein
VVHGKGDNMSYYGDKMEYERKMMNDLFGYSTPVPELAEAAEKTKGIIKSDGWETSYYDIPFSVKDVDDLIIHFELNWHMANIVKACLRYGKKDGVSKEYDLNKIDFMSKRERENVEEDV